MKKNIVAIAADNGKGKMIYIESLTGKDDGSYQTTTTFDPNIARDFHSKEKAAEYIPRLFNPWERNYKAVRLSVVRPVSENSKTNFE